MTKSAQSPISFQPEYLYSDLAKHYCITPDTQQQTKDQVDQAVARVEQKLTDQEYGFVEVLADQTYLNQVNAMVTQISWAKTLVVVGIGGSDLGARAIQVALEDQPMMEVIFHGDSTDPTQIQRLLRRIDLKQTVFNIISKSGQTIETISQYVFFKAQLQQQTDDWQKHFVFTTDDQAGILRTEADQHGVATLPIPESVGGRFSVLTPVGLLPSAVMGVDIAQLVQGASDFAGDQSARQMAQKLAATQYQLHAQGTKLAVIMPYSIQLEEFARWFRQLWGESLGKDGTGILPVQARGPADQHSQIQFYAQGEMMQLILFLRVESVDQDYQIESADQPELKYLEGKSFQQIVLAEQAATSKALNNLGRPSALISINQLDAYSLGQLFMLFELGVVYLAEMLGVNAFDQPGVESGKQLINELLGKK
jgi:glucose-6-phosphate isomerase